MPPTQEQSTLEERLDSRLAHILELYPKEMEEIKSAIRQELETLLDEVLLYSVKEKEDALAESQKKAKNDIQRAIYQAEFGRFQAFRDLEDRLTALRRKYTT